MNTRRVTHAALAGAAAKSDAERVYDALDTSDLGKALSEIMADTGLPKHQCFERAELPG